MENEASEKRCPACGKGVLVDVTFREGSDGQADEPIQTGQSRQVETYSCGHETVGPRLDRTAAGSQELQVEHRDSPDTVEPL